MKKFAVLGATGETGQQLLKLALGEGHEVVALCRNPSGLNVTHEKLKAVQADVFSIDSLKQHFVDCDAIFSCLGRSTSYTRLESTFYCDTMKVITQAMREAEIKRLVCMTSWATDYRRSEPGTFLVERVLKPFMRLTIGRILDDMQRMERYLIDDCQDLNYTIVRPPGLTNGPLSGAAVECEQEGQYVYSVSWRRIWMSRADVANFMLSTLNSADHDQKTVAIAVL
ncbi:oxidoreductase aflX-like [Patiria miniata]|uniref:NAD(P)-binding domain-containing protein n=1 Tax=Patiria miniata TaxID=46514 RepID=A0A913ZDX7_PATMI|nr:oxidoreductase aflX-like [Patiria miniata]